MQWILIYFAALSVIGFAMMAADKRKAVRAKRRISEKALFTIAWLGGSLGVYLGIFAFRHKTKHKKFTVGVPFIMAAQAAAVWFAYRFLLR